MNLFATRELSGPTLCALMVSHESGAHALACVRSLRREWQGAGYDPERLGLIVVDNGSMSNQSAYLDALEEEGAMVLRSKEDLGYAGGINLAWSLANQEQAEYVAILNPDMLFLPGSLTSMLAYLELHSACGAVGPRLFLDEECRFLLSPMPLPTAHTEISSVLSSLSPMLGRRASKRRARAALKLWRCDVPLPVDMLSGCCMIMPRTVVDSLEMLMDPRYPLYYEDADLCRRIAALGHTLVHVPDARVVRYWSSPAGKGPGGACDPRRRWASGQTAYLNRYFTSFEQLQLRVVESVAQRRSDEKLSRPIHKFSARGDFVRPIEIELSAVNKKPSRSKQPGPFMIEISLTPTFDLAAACFCIEGGLWSFPETAWNWLFAGRYYLRVTDLSSKRQPLCCSFYKSTPARTLKMEDAAPGRAPLDSLIPDAITNGEYAAFRDDPSDWAAAS